MSGCTKLYGFLVTRSCPRKIDWSYLDEAARITLSREMYLHQSHWLLRMLLDVVKIHSLANPGSDLTIFVIDQRPLCCKYPRYSCKDALSDSFFLRVCVRTCTRRELSETVFSFPCVHFPGLAMTCHDLFLVLRSMRPDVAGRRRTLQSSAH